MTRKKLPKKISFLLAASLLTAALPATTQADWREGVSDALIVPIGVAIGAASIGTALFSYGLGYCGLTLTSSDLSRDLSTAEVRKTQKGFLLCSLITGALAIAGGKTAYACFKEAYETYKEKNEHRQNIPGAVQLVVAPVAVAPRQAKRG